MLKYLRIRLKGGQISPKMEWCDYLTVLKLFAIDFIAIVD
jgi:hypothetical protein